VGATYLAHATEGGIMRIRSLAALKNAAALAPGELSPYLSREIQNVRGSAPAGVDGRR